MTPKPNATASPSGVTISWTGPKADVERSGRKDSGFIALTAGPVDPPFHDVIEGIGAWYRIVIDGEPSEAVQATFPFAPIGEALGLTPEQIAALAVLTMEDVHDGVELWKDHVPQSFRGLISGSWAWDEKGQFYVSPNGKRLADDDLRNLILLFILSVQHDLEGLAAAMSRGDPGFTIGDWEESVQRIARAFWAALVAVGVGGVAQVKPSDLADGTGSPDKPPGLWFTLTRLEMFAQAIEDRTPGADSEAAVTNRAGMYATAGYPAYEQARRISHQDAKDDEGRPLFLFERNILAPADHCSTELMTIGCPEVTAMGWQPIGSLVPIGDRTCQMSCKCSMEYSLVPVSH